MSPAPDPFADSSTDAALSVGALKEAAEFLLMLAGMGLFLLAPFFDRIVLAALKRRPAEVKAWQSDLWRDELLANAAWRADGPLIRAKLDAIDAALKELPDVARGLAALERLPVTLDRLDSILRSHGEQQARHDERLAHLERLQARAAYTLPAPGR